MAARFQSTRPRGARHEQVASRRDRHQVSIHAPARGATSLLLVQVRVEAVSIHAPARGPTPPTARCRRRSRGFNPRAREGRDKRVRRSWCRSSSFNPRAREGRDTASAMTAPSASVFQSTRPRGARRVDEEHVIEVIDVSIHAPARGATPVFKRTRISNQFQSTRPRGARPHHAATLLTALLFQSTRPRGARPPPTTRSSGGTCFNPRAREGRDSVGRVVP